MKIAEKIARKIPAAVFLVLFISCPVQAVAELQTGAQPNPETTQSGQLDPVPGIDTLDWMGGYWEAEYEGVAMEEVWLEPRGGMMLGQHRDTRSGGRTFFEYLRIEERPDGLVYLASPLGRPALEFRLAKQSEQGVVFENPDHDFPQQIEYWLDPDGRLQARVASIDQAKEATEWVFERRTACMHSGQ